MSLVQISAYMDRLDAHIGPMLKESGEVRRILTSDLALDAFFP